MALIKSTHAPATVAAFSMRDIEQQAQALVGRARRAAEQLIGEAQREAEVLRQEARDGGYAEGLAAGREAGHAEGLQQGTASGHQAALEELQPQLAPTWTALAATVSELDAMRSELESAAVREVVELAIAVARRVTKRQAAIDPQVLVDNLREAMRFAVQATDVKIVLHPAQRATMEAELPKLHMDWPLLKHVELVDDDTLLPGGCRVLTRGGEVDARIETQLDRIVAELLPSGEGGRGAGGRGSGGVVAEVDAKQPGGAE